MELRPGDFVFFKTHSLSGRAISWYQRRLFGQAYNQVTHVAVCVESPALVREAKMPRVLIRDYRVETEREIIVIARPKFLKFNARLQEELLEQKSINGQLYGGIQILGMAYYGLLSIIGHKPKVNPIRAGRVCTEDAYYFKKDMEETFGIVDNDGLQYDSIFPLELLDAFIRSDNYFIMTGLD
jgi:hypothetical protein